MKKYALIKDGVVSNVILIDADLVKNVTDLAVGPGYTYENGEFLEPVVVEEEPQA